MNAALLSAILEFIIAAIFLADYFRVRHKPTLFFGLAMLTYAIAHTVAGTALLDIKSSYDFKYQLFIKDINYKIFESLRNVFVGLFMFFILLAAVEYLKIGSSPKFKLIQYYTIAGLLAFLAMRLYCVWVIDNVKHLLFALAQWVYLIPGSLLTAYIILKEYQESKALGLLLVTASFMIYAIILPLYAMLKGTPHITIWYLMRALSELLLLIGILRAR
jgi:hypothetical protein